MASAAFSWFVTIRGARMDSPGISPTRRPRRSGLAHCFSSDCFAGWSLAGWRSVSSGAQWTSEAAHLSGLNHLAEPFLPAESLTDREALRRVPVRETREDQGAGSAPHAVEFGSQALDRCGVDVRNDYVGDIGGDCVDRAGEKRCRDTRA